MMEDMGKVEVQKLKAGQRQRLQRMLASLLESMASGGEIQRFLPAFFTPSELIMFGRRIETALELIRGASGEDIRRKHGIAYTTISLIDDMLRTELLDYRSTIPELLKRPARVIARGAKRLKERAPLIAALVELIVAHPREKV
jgi:Trp operon repressor